MPTRCDSRNDDAALVRRLQSGDERAFEAIFKRHHAPLLSYCRHMLSSQDEAEDALQQAFIKAHQALLAAGPRRASCARGCTRSRATAASRRSPPAGPPWRSRSTRRRWRGSRRRSTGARTCASWSPGSAGCPRTSAQRCCWPSSRTSATQAIATIVGCEVSKVKALIYQARSALIADRDARARPARTSANSSRWPTAANFAAGRCAGI